MENVERAPARRIGVVASEAMRVLGLGSLFADDSQTEVLPIEAVAALRDRELALVILDSSGTAQFFEMLDAFRRSRPELKLIVLGPEQDHAYIQRVIGAGAKGYIALTATLQEIAMAIDVVMDGSIWAPRKVMARLLESDRAAQAAVAALPVQLTAREHDVLEMLIAGGSNREIAVSLGIDEATVKAHVGRLLRKYRVPNRTALSVQVMQRKLG